MDVAARREAEARLAFLISEITTLHVLDVAVEVAIGNEERGGIIESSAETPTGGWGGDAADAYPLDDLGAKVALLEEERLSLSYQRGVAYEASEKLYIEWVLLDFFRLWNCMVFSVREENVLVVGEPMASVEKRLAQYFLRQGDDIAMGIADETLEGVRLLVERERRMLVAVEGAEGLVMGDRHAQTLGYLLYREGAELFDFILLCCFPNNWKIFIVY